MKILVGHRLRPAIAHKRIREVGVDISNAFFDAFHLSLQPFYLNWQATACVASPGSDNRLKAVQQHQTGNSTIDAQVRQQRTRARFVDVCFQKSHMPFDGVVYRRCHALRSKPCEIASPCCGGNLLGDSNFKQVEGFVFTTFSFAFDAADLKLDPTPRQPPGKNGACSTEQSPYQPLPTPKPSIGTWFGENRAGDSGPRNECDRKKGNGERKQVVSLVHGGGDCYHERPNPSRPWPACIRRLMRFWRPSLFGAVGIGNPVRG